MRVSRMSLWALLRGEWMYLRVYLRGGRVCLWERVRGGRRGLVGSWLGRGGEGGIDVADEDALAEVGVGGFAKFGGLGAGLRRGADDVEAGDTAIEPEAGYVGEVGGGDVGVEVEQDAYV